MCRTFAVITLNLFVGLSLLACTRQAPESSKMRIRLPSAGAPSSKLHSKSSGDISSSVASSGWGIEDPSLITDIMCYAVGVAGPEEILKGKACKDSSGKQIINVGLLKGLYAAGSEVVLEVPSGLDRIFYLIGFSADSMDACKDFTRSGGRPLQTSLSAPHIVAQKKTSLKPGDQSLTLFASLDDSIKLGDCDWDGTGPAIEEPVLPVPVISSVDVYVNGVLQGPPPVVMAEGDFITMTVNATDPNSLPLEYSFHIFRNCSLAETHQGFSSSNSMISYTATSADINACNSIAIGVRNNDGNDYDGSLFGDVQYSIPLSVSNGSAAPVVNSVDVYVNGMIQGPPPINMNVGDTISITVNATDPNSLPLEYVFHNFQNCSLASTLQSFSGSNTLSSYTATINDVNGCDSIAIGVKNNDGIDFDSSLFGDLQYPIELIVSNGSIPPTVNAVDVYVNGVLQGAPPINVVVGDVITMNVQATDPNALPLEYVFHLFRDCGLATTLQSFSVSNLLSPGYTLTASDVTACTNIVIGVRNNDGIDFDSSLFGDLQHQIGFTVTAP